MKTSRKVSGIKLFLVFSVLVVGLLTLSMTVATAADAPEEQALVDKALIT